MIDKLRGFLRSQPSKRSELKKLIKDLESQRKQEERQAAEHLLHAGYLEKAKLDLSWIENCSTVLDSMHKRLTRRRMWAGSIAVIAFLIASIMWSTPITTITRIQVVLDIHSKAVTLNLAEQWATPSRLFTTDQLRIEGLAKISAPGLDINIKSKTGDAWLDIKGGVISMSKLELGENGTLELVAERDYLTFFFRNDNRAGTISVVGNTKLSVNEEMRRTKPREINPLFPEMIDFAAEGSEAIPTKFKFRSQEGWRLQGLQVKGLGFLEERESLGSVSFVSAIKEGTVSLFDVPSTEELRDGDRLSLKGVDGRRLEIAKEADRIKLLFEGTVREILVGPEGFEQNLAPSILEWVYHRERFGFFWGAIGFLYTLLWSLRTTLFQ